MLTENMINSGLQFVNLLDTSNVSPKAVFWFYLPDNNDWKLIVANVDDKYKSPKKFYTTVQNIMAIHGASLKDLTIDQIKLALPNSPIVELLGFAINTGNGISGVRFRGNVINGTLIEDAYIYRLTN